MNRRRFVRSLSSVTIVVGLALLSYVAYVTVRARVYQRAFDAAAHAPSTPGLSAPSSLVPLTPPPAIADRAALVEGATIGEIRIDRIGLRTVISEGETDAILDLGAGHLADTPWTDQAGNVVLAGHRDTVFRPLEQVRVGDVVDVTTTSRLTRYRVTSTSIVEPTDLSVLDASSDNTLTLITCFPFVYVGHAPHRFIVRASEIR